MTVTSFLRRKSWIRSHFDGPVKLIRWSTSLVKSEGNNEFDVNAVLYFLITTSC